MSECFESASYVLPSEVRNEVAGHLKESKGIQSMELRMHGDSLEGAQEFGQLLIALRKRGVKISHDLTIKLEFPRAITRDKALALVENMPKPRNGSVKVRVELSSAPKI